MNASENFTRFWAESQPMNAWGLWCALSVVLVFSTGSNVFDPYFIFDDFSALASDPSGFWVKTLSEGRWLTYLWHWRPVATPAWVNFIVFQSAIAGFAVLVLLMLRREFAMPRWLQLMTCLVLGLSHFYVDFARWPSTSALFMLLPLVYGWACLWFGARVAILLMPVAVAAAAMSYTSTPFVVLFLCLLAQEQRSLRRLAWLCAGFMVALIASNLAIFAINYAVHDVFGVLVEPSRQPQSIGSVSQLLRNLQVLWLSLESAFFGFGGQMQVVKLVPVGLWLCSALVVWREDRLWYSYLIAAPVLGLGVLIALCLLSGAAVPVRGFYFVWGPMGAMFASALLMARRFNVASGGVLIMSLASVAAQLTFSLDAFRATQGWQTATGTLVAELSGFSGAIFVTGSMLDHPLAQAAVVEDERAIATRVKQLSGREVTICPSRDVLCPVVAKDADLVPSQSGFDAEFAVVPQGVVINFAGEPIEKDTQWVSPSVAALKDAVGGD